MYILKMVAEAGGLARKLSVQKIRFQASSMASGLPAEVSPCQDWHSHPSESHVRSGGTQATMEGAPIPFPFVSVDRDSLND